ncbi:MAG: hypothetical protein ACOC4I_00540 [Spirochaetota bacterium]
MSAEEEKKEFAFESDDSESSELDEYGVWVKSGPEDVESDSDNDESVEDLALEDVQNDASFDSMDLESESFDDDFPTLSGETLVPDGGFDDTELSDDDVPEDIPEDESEDAEMVGSEPSEEMSFSMDDDEVFPESESELTAEEEALLSELENDEYDESTDSEATSETDETDVAETSTHELGSDDFELDDLEMDIDLDDEDDENNSDDFALGDSDDFDDVEAVTRDLTSDADESEQHAETRVEPEPTAEPTISNPITQDALEKIEGELSGIRNEIAALKSELSELYGLREAARQSGLSPEGAENEDVLDDVDVPEQNSEDFFPEDEEGGGFFDDDGDETIALTGDELDNILSTAEFTEEAGQPSEFEDESTFEASLENVSSEEPHPADAPDTEDEADVWTELAAGDSEPVDVDEQDDLLQEPDADEGEIAFDDENEDSSFDESTVTIGSDIDVQNEFDSPVSEIDLEADEYELTIEDDTDEESETNEEIDALANMDIESELADIDELTDEEDTSTDFMTESDDSAPEGNDLQEPEPEIEAPVSELSEENTRNVDDIPSDIREEIRAVLTYMDQLLESLPEEKIKEFAESEHFEVYKRLFEELDLEP